MGQPTCKQWDRISQLATAGNSKAAPVARKRKRRLELQVEFDGERVDALEQHVQEYLILTES
jgi:hypothetical protein